MIKTSNLTFAYPGKPPILKDITLVIPSGSHVALMGKNGSGKSTFALLLKGLLSPSSGTVTINGFSADSEKSRFEIMKRVGLVFQNPDNTIVATTVERELAFGLENMSVPPEEMKERVNTAIQRFDLDTCCHANPANLSGGEKQRLALAAVMIMRPSHLILDEPTSLLDPWNREHIMQLVHSTVQEGTTVIHITPFASETLLADRVLVLEKSRICMDGPPEEILPKTKRFRSVFAGYQAVVEPEDSKKSECDIEKHIPHSKSQSAKPGDTLFLALDAVTHWYDKGSPFENRALNNITLRLFGGSSTALIGPAGSGKTTLLEIAAGVTVPTQGRVQENGSLVRAMAFQFPEDHLFGETVESYVAFGPKNMGVTEGELHDVVSNALEDVGLAPENYRDRDPFTLSGGEKRRVALAGVLVMKPDVLILDEPTAGLDWEGIELILAFLRKYVQDGGTLLFSTHDFDSAQCLADRAVVLYRGNIEMYGPADEIFSESEWMTSLKAK